MNNGVRYILVFSLGAAIGSAVTWKMLKTKYEKIANEEIESVREVYARKYGEKTDHETVDEAGENLAEGIEEVIKDPIGSVQKQFYADYEETLKKAGYKNYANSDDIPPGVIEVDEVPYVIEPDAYGELDDYELETLSYYSDGVLADDFDNPIIDVAGLVGADFAEHFGEYEDDTVHVRNNRYKTDYEILRDTRPFSMVAGTDVTSDSEDE